MVEGIVDILGADILTSNLILHTIKLRGVIEPFNDIFLHHLEEKLLEIVAF